jgi:hypothetical protein
MRYVRHVEMAAAMIAQRFFKRLHPAILTCLLVVLCCLPALAMPPLPVQAQTARIGIEVDANGSIDAQTLESRFRPTIDTARDELEILFATSMDHPLTIAFGAGPDRLVQQTWQRAGSIAWIDPALGTARVDLDAFLQLSPLEAGNVLRNLIARQLLFQAAHGALPAGLNDGIAAYVERPILAQQARRGSLVQQVALATALPDLPALINAGPTLLDPETTTALHYAFVAFIIDHYGLGNLQALVLQSVTAITWQTPLTTATNQNLEQIETAWKQFLPRWFAGGWQSNAVSAFDLAPAQALFDRGAYSSAITLAEASQQLFDELDDQPRLSEVEAFIELSAIGVRAEQLMKDVQTALDKRDYVQAAAKLTDAEAQYAYLPESHRPGALIATYQEMIGLGNGAIADLNEAQSLSGIWSKTHQARELARSSGNTFAALGDATRRQEAAALVDQLSLRLQRITLAAVALVMLIAMWLLIWLWARAPQRFLWIEPHRPFGKVA